jgi:hypothetical protein
MEVLHSPSRLVERVRRREQILVPKRSRRTIEVQGDRLGKLFGASPEVLVILGQRNEPRLERCSPEEIDLGPQRSTSGTPRSSRSRSCAVSCSPCAANATRAVGSDCPSAMRRARAVDEALLSRLVAHSIGSSSMWEMLPLSSRWTIFRRERRVQRDDAGRHRSIRRPRRSARLAVVRGEDALVRLAQILDETEVSQVRLEELPNLKLPASIAWV